MLLLHTRTLTSHHLLRVMKSLMGKNSDLHSVCFISTTWRGLIVLNEHLREEIFPIQVSPLVVCLPVCVSFYWSSTRNVQLAILFMTNSLLHAGGTG